jgi:hypothetical protein
MNFLHVLQRQELCLPTFERYATDIVVKWDGEDHGHDVCLQVALWSPRRIPLP